jgi:hypothetical protein
MFALGPFSRHARALGLVGSVRRLVTRAELDRSNVCAYGTGRVPFEAAPLPTGVLNDLMDVGPDWRGPLAPPASLNPLVMERLHYTRKVTHASTP